MIKIEEKQTICIDIDCISLKYLIDFYEKNAVTARNTTIFLVYDTDRFVTSVSYRDIANFKEEEELFYFIRYANIYMFDFELNEKNVEKIFRESAYCYYDILAEKPSRSKECHKFYNRNAMLDHSVICETYNELYEILQKKKINVYRVKIPVLSELSKPHEKFNYMLGDKWLTLLDKKEFLLKNLNKITDKSYDEVVRCFPKQGMKEKIGEGKKKIYLVGACIAAGWCHFEDEELAYDLYQEILRRNFDFEIIKVLQTRSIEDSMKRILEYDICQNDIVIFLDDYMSDNELDVKYLYDNYDGDKWLFTDIPIHTTKEGNILLAAELINRIIEPVYLRSEKSNDDVVLHQAERALRFDEEQEIIKYLGKIEKKSNLQTGAIVMNANPFTLGHRYLVETAKNMVDYLYIFVVEEDCSYYTFEDRLKMVKAGVQDMENVSVVPSGKFIISKGTFKNYFEKDYIADEQIDASNDICIFGTYIAPYLGISKRFVGEEPNDSVTRQYNEQMKEILPRYGIDLIEIPRKENNHEIISASTVRKSGKEDAWDKVSEMVPYTTFEVIRNYSVKREITEQPNVVIDKMREYIQNNDKLIVYGIGKNTQKLIGNIEIEDCKKIIFCDKKASENKCVFQGREVISPTELYRGYSDYNILITSHLYCKEIYFDLRHHGINRNKIWCNCWNI